MRTPQRNGKISREQAIGLGEFNCERSSPPKQYPTNIEANLVTEKEALTKLNDENSGSSTKEVWLITMDGAWVFMGGPEPQANETRVTALFKHCAVILDAKTGEFMRLQRHASIRPTETVAPNP